MGTVNTDRIIAVSQIMGNSNDENRVFDIAAAVTIRENAMLSISEGKVNDRETGRVVAWFGRSGSSLSINFAEERDVEKQIAVVREINDFMAAAGEISIDSVQL